MADANYEPSRSGWAKIAMSDAVLDACMSEARKGKRYAESISPRSGDGVGNPYADSFEVVPSTTIVFRRGPRVMAVLYNDAPHAAAVEWSNKRQPQAHRVLGRTAAYLGST